MNHTKKHNIMLVFVCMAVFCLNGCAFSNNTSREMTYFAMDTIMEFTAYGGNAEDTLNETKTIIQSIEETCSATDPDSMISCLNREGSIQVNEEFLYLLQSCAEYSEETGLSFHPGLYDLTTLWGFTGGTPHLPDDCDIQQVLSKLPEDCGISFDGNAVFLNNVHLDLGAAVKGYTSDCLAELWKENNVSGVISLGGNVQTVGEKTDGTKWRIAVRDPFEPSETIGILSVDEKAIVTSGGYQRYFEENGVRYSHIIDSSTGYPANGDISSVTIVADSGLLADCFSTALYVMGEQKACDFWRSRYDFEAVLVTTDGRVIITEGLKDCFSGQSCSIITR